MSLLQQINETKSLGKKVTIVKGEHKGKSGVIREIKHGLYKGADKSFYIDLADGKQANNLPGSAFRLVKEMNEGAMMDDEGTFVYKQDGASNVSITVNANSADEADRKLKETIADADDLGIAFSEENWEIVSSF